MTLFVVVLWALGFVCVVLFLYTKNVIPTTTDDAFYKFQRTYLCVYLLATGSDWMQGPYVYALYDAYGLSTHDIEVLFVAGYASSLIFGTVVGSVADKYGRRKNCLLFALLYGMSCCTKHFNNFNILLIGRLLSGISTSLLCSAFESWMVCEYHKKFIKRVLQNNYSEALSAQKPWGNRNAFRERETDEEKPVISLALSRGGRSFHIGLMACKYQKQGFDSSLLTSMFSHAVLGNSVVAIFSGVLAQVTADRFGYVAPFDVAIFLLLVLSCLILCTWGENYGDPLARPLQNFKTAIATIKTDHRILCLGLIQTLFEGSMYTFVLEWTPALMATERELPLPEGTAGTSDSTGSNTDEDHRGTIPHGYIFASFMVAIMIGSSLFKLFSRTMAVESFMRPVLLVASFALLLPILYPQRQIIVLLSFLLFEVCVGIFWPSLGTMRGKYIPEASRATIMNLFRVPLNLIVVIILTQNFPMTVIFECCVVFLLIAALCQVYLNRVALLVVALLVVHSVCFLWSFRLSLSPVSHS